MNHTQKTEYMKKINVGKMLEDQEANATAISEAEAAVDDKQAILKATKTRLGLEDARLAVETKGKNAEERKLNFALAKGKDEAYVIQANAIVLAEGELADAMRVVSDAQRQHGAINNGIRLTIGLLHFMAGEE